MPDLVPEGRGLDSWSLSSLVSPDCLGLVIQKLKFCSVRFHFPAENTEFGAGHLYDPLEQRAKTAKRRAFMELNEWIQAVATVGKRSLSVSF